MELSFSVENWESYTFLDLYKELVNHHSGYYSKGGSGSEFSFKVLNSDKNIVRCIRKSI
jgi:hypothetical protein